MRIVKKSVDFLAEFLPVLFIVGLIMAFITGVELKIAKIPRAYEDRIWLSNIILALLVYAASIWLYKGRKEKEKEDEDESIVNRIFKDNENLFKRIRESLSGEASYRAEKGLLDIARGRIPEPRSLLQLDKVFGKEAVDKFMGRSEDTTL
jgi:hypothetical protein